MSFWWGRIVARRRSSGGSHWAVLALLIATLAPAPAAALSSLSVVDENGGAVGSYRWLLEEDTTHPVTLGAHDADSTGVTIHTSHNPVVASGDSGDLAALFAGVDPTKRYFVSILANPVGAFTQSGTPIAAGQDAATVTVLSNPLESAQLSVFVFMDDNKTNSEPDLRPIPAIPGAPMKESGIEGFEIRIYDAIVGEQSFFDTYALKRCLNEIFGFTEFNITFHRKARIK